MNKVRKTSFQKGVSGNPAGTKQKRERVTDFSCAYINECVILSF